MMRTFPRLLLLGLVAFSPAFVLAQTMPMPDLDNPRLQSLRYTPGEEYLLTTLPNTGVTVMLEQGEQIQRVAVSDQRALDVKVSSERDSLIFLPLANTTDATVEVTSDRRSYNFRLQSADSLMAAYLVRFDYGAGQATPQAQSPALVEDTGETWNYRLRGDRSVRPTSITDNGKRTMIRFAEDQSLPGVFAIGPTGKEQVVNGYMRDDVFVIDRIWQELVFRIDKDKARARRNSSPETVYE